MSRVSGVQRLSGVLAVAWTVMAQAQTAVQDGFESGAFAAEWDTVSAGVTVKSGGGAAGSTRCAALPTLKNLGHALHGGCAVRGHGAAGLWLASEREYEHEGEVMGGFDSTLLNPHPRGFWVDKRAKGK